MERQQKKVFFAKAPQALLATGLGKILYKEISSGKTFGQGDMVLCRKKGTIDVPRGRSHTAVFMVSGLTGGMSLASRLIDFERDVSMIQSPTEVVIFRRIVDNDRMIYRMYRTNLVEV